MLDLKYCPSPRISPERASRLLHKNTNRSYRCLVICATVNCSMGSTRHRSLGLLIWPTRRYPHCFIPFSLSPSHSHLPSNPEQDSGFCTPQDTKNKIITPVHLDMRFKISRYKGNRRDRRPNSQQPIVISARCPQHRESEKATDSKNILIRHTVIFRPTLILPSVHRGGGGGSQQSQLHGYCTVIISNYFPSSCKQRLTSSALYLLDWWSILLLRMGWEPFLEEGQMCGSVGISIFSVCGLRVGLMCASDVIQLEIFAFLEPVQAIT